MLKGDLVTTPLPAVLRQLADGVASGCLHVDDGVGEEAKVYFRGGQVYAVQVPGRRPQLGARLVSSGALGPEALAEALEAQRTELQGWRLGELLVHLGYVDQPVVEAFIHEQVREQTSDLMRWPTGTWKFRVNERTREDVAPPTPVEDLLEEVAERARLWETINEVLHGPDAVPLLSSAGQTDAEMSIDPDAWSLLCKVDGSRSIAELARECGFTLFEAGQVVYSLVRSGLLEVEEVVIGAEEPPVAGSVTSRLAAAFAPSIPAQAAEEPTPADVANLITAALREDRTAADLVEHDDVEGSLDRVSAALSALLGPTTDDHLFDAPKPRATTPKPLSPEDEAREAKKAEKRARDAKRREKDAAELAAAQAELEAARQAEAEAAAAALAADHEAEIVSLEEVRREAARREEEEAAEAARLAEEQAAAEEAARVEAERLAAEAEAQRLAEEQAAEEAARVEAERLAAEAEAQRLAEEQAAAEEAARLEAERLAAEAEAQRLADEEWERLQAEEAARAEAERVAAEQAEAERLAAEEAARVEAERVAAEAEAQRVAEEQAAAEEAARVEAERIAAEQAEAERVAAEELAAQVAAELAEAQAAEQAAAEEAARVEAERLAQERAAAEEELRAAAEKQAAEAEANRLAAEAAAEAQRLAEEQAALEAEHEEQVRLAAQRASAGDAFAELSATAATASDVQVLEAPAEAEEAEVEEELPVYRAPDTDMASLFRELSSLGMDDAPEPPPTRPASPPRPVTPAAAPAKKKKGLFGR